MTPDGSSPHAWETRDILRKSMVDERFIPTRVGNTSISSALSGAMSVHPHTRGKHDGNACDFSAGYGSSPHAWETPTTALLKCSARRFIPTRVGNTKQNKKRRLIPPVHPHTRGKHVATGAATGATGGSSPHAWETPFEGRIFIAAVRFIPTRVGNTNTASHAALRTSVHPHTRGKHTCDDLMSLRSDGSSPHAWETRAPAWIEKRCLRFIPTRVGNTFLGRRINIRVSVHPHTRGKHEKRAFCFCQGVGSSPHAWETPEPAGQALPFLRFIPTRVGNTTQKVPSPRNCPVHPHTRGKHFERGVSGEMPGGSSPHAWETQHGFRHGDIQRRFIPTRVGNTQRSSPYE